MSSSTNETRVVWWDVGDSEIVDSWPLMGSPVSMLTIVASYLLFVLYLGPRYMKHRESYKLKSLMLMYNMTQVIMSLYVVCLIFPYLIEHGMIWLDCFMVGDSLKNKMLRGMWVYLAIKISELLDTVMFVLRKKYEQVSFLHVYHHTVLVTASWVYLKYTPADHIMLLGFINSLVHVIMYTYYGLAALGPGVQPYLFWKKYITTLQLVQFVIILFQILISLTFSSCPPHRFWAYFIVFNALLFIYLFTQFYKKTYTTDSRNKLKKSS